MRLCRPVRSALGNALVRRSVPRPSLPLSHRRLHDGSRPPRPPVSSHGPAYAEDRPSHHLSYQALPHAPRSPLPQQSVASEIAAERGRLREREAAGEHLSYTDLAPLLERAAKAVDLTTVRQLLADINMRGLKHTTPSALTALLQTYARFDQIDQVSWVAEQLRLNQHELDTNAYTAWIMALVRRRKMKEAELKFEEMKRNKQQPSLLTYNAMLGGYAADLNKERVQATLTEMDGLGQRVWNEFTYAPLVHMYARRGEPAEVRVLMQRLVESGKPPSVRLWNSLLSALAKANQFDKMNPVLQEMVSHRVMPVSETYNILINARAKMGDFAGAQERINEMIESGLRLHVHTFSPIIASRASRGEMEQAEEVLVQMKQHAVVPTSSEGMILINGWLEKNDVDRAQGAMRKVLACGTPPSRGFYVPLVGRYAQERKLKEARQLVSEMKQHNFVLEDWMARILAGESAAAAGGKAAATSPPSNAAAPGAAGGEQSPWTVAERTAHVLNLLKSNRLSAALQVLDSMEKEGPAPTVMTYTQFVQHYGFSGQVDRMEEMTTRMRARNVEPDSVLTAKLLRAYAQHKHWNRAQGAWRQLQQVLKKEGKSPAPEHYHDAIITQLRFGGYEGAKTLLAQALAERAKLLGGTWVQLIQSALQHNQLEECCEWTELAVRAGYTITEPLAGRVRQAREQLQQEREKKSSTSDTTSSSGAEN